MSHLTSRQNKETIKRVVLLVLGITIIGFLAIQIGLKSVINATLFLNTFTGNKSEEKQDSNDSFFGTLQLDEPVNATNSAEMYVSGSASEYDTLEFYINNTKVDEKPATDSFNEKIGKLRVGENKVYVVAKTKKGNKKESSKYNVVYKNKPPTLEINSPKDGDTVSKQDVQVDGKTDPNVTVSINHQPVVVDFQGNFKKTMRLKEGENKLEILAADEAGNNKTTTLIIKWQKDE